MVNRDKVILVDEFDNPIGVQEKLAAHEEGNLHRAISVLIYNKKGEILLQKRAKSKYHSPSLWSNAACTHPQENEESIDAAKSRLYEELGFTCDLEFLFSFTYKTEFENGLIEHEFDHVFWGEYDGKMNINPLEASEVKYVKMNWLKKDIKENPRKYTDWFKILFNKIEIDH